MTIAASLSGLAGKPALGADEALAARRAIYGGKAQIKASEADALLACNDAAREVSPEWRALLEEAVLEFVVLQQDPEGYVDEAKGDWLVAVASRSAPVRQDLLEILIRVLEEAQSTPARLSAFVLEAVKAAVLRSLAQTGRLDRDKIDMLRRVVFAVGGDGNIAVTQREAEALFDVNDALEGKSADPAWTEFFAHAVGNAVLFRSSWTPNAQDERRREAWLEDAHPHVLRRLQSLTHLRADETAIESGFQELAQRSFEDDAMGRLAADLDRTERDADRVTADEAHWLLGRIGRGGRFNAGETALLAFLRANASAIDPFARRAGTAGPGDQYGTLIGSPR